MLKVIDTPSLLIITPKEGVPEIDAEDGDSGDGDDFVAPVNPYERAEEKKKARKKKIVKPDLYDTFVDQMLSEIGLDHTVVGQIWHEIEKENKVQIVLLCFGAFLALLISGVFSLLWIAIFIEAVSYLYSTNSI